MKSVRTTIDLPVEDLTRLKIAAARRHTSVKNLVREAVAEYLAEPKTGDPGALETAFKSSDLALESGMETWDLERINAEVRKRRAVEVD